MCECYQITYFRVVKNRFILAMGWVVLLGMAWWGSCSPSDPGNSSQGSKNYLGLGPDVHYTGMGSCQPCHQSIYESYLETGMGQSLYKPARSKIIERFGASEVVFDGPSGYGYHPYWEGERLMMLEFRLENGDTTFRRTEKIDFIVGSGHQTRSYLLERSGHYYEVPITWYVNQQKWDLSPGYEGGNNSRFDREIGEECMACHTGHMDFVQGSVNQFREVSLGIDCEKCHGPGSAHIMLKEEGELIDVGKEIDYSIVNPAKLGIQLQFDVCKQCHLQGVTVLKDGGSVQDFRPGMALTDVYDIFIEEFNTSQDFGIASHAERLIQSRCFIASGDQLTCTTCHNPHKSISVTDPMVYSRQCQNCHQAPESVECSASPEMLQGKAGDCIACHMPKGGTSDIPHVTFTDHHIRVVRDSVPTEEVRRFLQLVCMTDSQPKQDLLGKAYLLYFERNSHSPEHLEIAANNLSDDSHGARARLLFYQGNYQTALQEVELALPGKVGDPHLMFLKGEIQEALGQMGIALQTFKQVFQQSPHLAEAGLKAGVLVLKTATDPAASLQEARSLFEQALLTKPFDKRLHMNMGFVEMNSGNLPQAEKRFADALAYDPSYLQALENMVLLQSHMGDPKKGKLYLQKLLVHHPDYPKKGMLQALVEG